jgi:hypothetical protein
VCVPCHVARARRVGVVALVIHGDVLVRLHVRWRED